MDGQNVPIPKFKRNKCHSISFQDGFIVDKEVSDTCALPMVNTVNTVKRSLVI